MDQITCKIISVDDDYHPDYAEQVQEFTNNAAMIFQAWCQASGSNSWKGSGYLKGERLYLDFKNEVVQIAKTIADDGVDDVTFSTRKMHYDCFDAKRTRLGALYTACEKASRPFRDHVGMTALELFVTFGFDDSEKALESGETLHLAETTG